MSGGGCGDVTIWTTHPWVEVEPSKDAELVGSWSTTFDEEVSSETQLGTYTMTFRSDGSMQMEEAPGDIGYYGDYSIFRGRLESPVPRTPCRPPSRSTATRSPSLI